MKKLLIILTILAFPFITNAALTLYEYYDGHLPSVSQRAKIAQSLGISNYTGTALQNNKLLNFLQKNASFGTTIPNVVAVFETSLASKITSSATSMTLVSGTTADGTTLSGVYGFVIDEGTASEEFVLATCASTACSSMTRGVSTITGTSTVATLQKEHRKGASVKMTDHPILTTIARILNGYGTLPALLSYDSSLIGDIISSASTTLTSKSYVDSREGYWESSVANFAALPTGTIDGETRVTLDDNKIYVWDSTTVAWILAGSGGGAGTIYKTVQLGSDCNTRTCSLSSGSWNDSKWLSVYLNGVLMEEGASADYTASSTGDDILFNFDLNANDKIFMRVDSIDYYNPAWGSVDANIVPDTNNSYDLGSASKSFKNLYASGTAQIYGNTTLDGNLTVNGGMAANRTVTAPLDVAINGSVTPQLVSYHTETGFVVEANASSASTTRPFGFVTTNALASTSPNIIVSGVVDGFTGLATNTEYYLSDTNGEISATQGTRIVPVGRAISATQLLINFGTKKYIFQPTISTNADWSQGTIATGTFYVGFKPEKIKITGQTVTQGTNTRDDIFDISVMGESNAMNGWKFLYFNNTSWGATSWDPIQGDTTMALSNPGGTNSGYWNLAFSTKTDTYITIILTYTLKSNGGCSISISNTLVEVEGN